jgi:hypothetical protein
MATRTVRRTLALAAALAVVVGCSRQPRATPTPAATSQPVVAPAADPKRCPVTIPNGNGPPGEQPSPTYYGNGRLWTGLAPNGIDNGGTLEPDGSISQKYGWFTVGTMGGLTIQGRRVDASAPPPRARINSGVPETPFATVPGGRFWASSIYFPTEGCWQVTGRVGRTSLTFVVFVAKPD